MRGPFAPGRPRCDACHRALVACYCRHLAVLPTRTRVLILQHPRERDNRIGTARMAQLSLPNSELRVGLDFAADPVVQTVLADEPQSYLLFPGPEAAELRGLPRDRPLTLVVLDGTWSQARKLLRINPALAALQRVGFVPSRPSGYRIRRQPAPHCVSTIEAIGEVLSVLEPEAIGEDQLTALLEPFRQMNDQQVRYAAELRACRHAPAANERRARRRATLAARLLADWQRLVCVQGEANAWSSRDPAGQPPEIVHWVAHRLATGDTYQALIAPRRPIAPSTSRYVEITAEGLQAGIAVEEWRRTWGEFSRPDDVFVNWGRYFQGVASADGLPLAEPDFDLRSEVTRELRMRTGTIEQCVADLGIAPPSLPVPGRAGRRLSALVGLARELSRPP